MIRHQNLLGIAIGAAVLVGSAAPALADKNPDGPQIGQAASANTCAADNSVTPDNSALTTTPLFNPNGIAAVSNGVMPASMQMPVLVTGSNGSLSYSTPQNGPFIDPRSGNNYVTANGGPVLITNPNGSQSYANVNGVPSLASGPNGSLSYQYVVAGSQGSGGTPTIGYLNSNNSSAPLIASEPLNAGDPLVSSGGSSLGGGLQLLPPKPPVQRVAGRYHDLAGGGGQIWVAAGAPLDGATC